MLTPGEISPKMIITIVKWNSPYDDVDTNSVAPEMAFTIKVANKTPKHDYCGIPLKVKAVDLPYIVTYDFYQKRNVIVDTRLVELKELNSAYIQALGLGSEIEVNAEVEPSTNDKAKTKVSDVKVVKTEKSAEST